MKNTQSKSTQDLLLFWKGSPEPTTKISNYFNIYSDLFTHLRGTKCTFIETGVLDGGSLFMWRNWLGPDARIIGIDLNPEASKWIDYGFEIYIGDQGDRHFWKKILEDIGEFDVLLDDGGHQSFQQIVTAEEAIIFAKNDCIIAIEDTASNFMKDFQCNSKFNFLNFAKDITDNLIAKTSNTYPNRFINLDNFQSIQQYSNIYKVDFYSGIVAFHISSIASKIPESIQNMDSKSATDFRYNGVNNATVIWPNPREILEVHISGGRIEELDNNTSSSQPSLLTKIKNRFLTFIPFLHK